MSDIKITFSDGKTKKYPVGTTYETISKDFPGSYPYVGVKVNNVIFSLDDCPEKDTEVNFIDFIDRSGYKMYLNGIKFIFEVALKKTFPNYEVHYLHSHPKGLYAEVTGKDILTDEDFKKIKSKMASIVTENIPIKKYNVSKKDAIKFYNDLHYYEKAFNVHNFADNVVAFYVIDKYINFYYSQMPNNTGIMKLYDVKYLGDNKLIILLPSKLSSGRVPEFIKYESIIETYNETKNWLNVLDMNYISDLNKKVSNSVIDEFMAVSEIKFNDEIRGIVKEVCERPKVKFIMIAGPSSSGKTTTTNRLKTYLQCCGYDPIVISTDDYFVDRDTNPKDENGECDFECLHAVNTEKLSSDIRNLLKGKEVTLPIYDFVSGTGNQSGIKVKMNERSIFLIEGLHALNDDLIPGIDNDLKFKIYISPFIGVNIDRHNYISTTDLRLLRRIVRDNRTRGKKVEDTISYWEKVRQGETNYIFPYIHQADIVINTALNYEIGVLEVYALPLLISVSIDSPYYEEARRLIEFLKVFCPIPSEYVSKDSILREFIGG